MNRRPKSVLRWLCLALGVLILAGWWFKAPALWMAQSADRFLQKHDSHAALGWIDRSTRWGLPENRAALLFARAYLQLNLNGPAQRWLDKAIVLDGESPTTRMYQQMVQAQRGDATAAEGLLQDSDNLGATGEAYEAVLRSFQISGAYQRARLMLDQMEKGGGFPELVSYHRGRLAEIDELYAEAEQHYDSALRRFPKAHRAAFRAGVCAYKLKEFDRALQHFRTLEQSPYREVADIEIANCLWEKDEIEGAKAVLESSLDVSTDILQTQYLPLDEYVDADRATIVAARIHDKLGQSQTVVDLLERVLAYNHRDFEARALLIKHLQLLGRQTQAKEMIDVQTKMVASRQRSRQLRQELIDYPKDLERLGELAELYWYVESEAEALLVLDDIFRIDPRNPRALRLQTQIESERQRRNRR